MRISLVAATSAIVLLLASPQVSMAKSIKDLLTTQQVTDFCTANGLGEKSAQLTLPDGTVVTGTIDCESENVAGAGPTDPSAVSSEEGEDDLSSASQEDDNNEGTGGDNSGTGDDGNDGNGGGGGDNGGGDNGGGDNGGGDGGSDD